jgi:hypothetical protein
MGLPEGKLPWTLDAREKRVRGTKDDGVPLTACEECGKPYERFYRVCPHCGHEPQPAKRSTPEQVDGDLELLDKAALQALLLESSRVMDTVKVPRHLLGTPAERAILARHNARFAAQVELRDSMARWAGWETAEGLSVPEAQRKFFLRFGVDVLSAQALGASESAELKAKIEERILKHANT